MFAGSSSYETSSFQQNSHSTDTYGMPKILLYHDDYFDRLPESVLSIGASNSGKTFSICYFIQTLRNKIRDSLVITGSDAAEEFGNIIDRPKIYTELDANLLKAFFLSAENHAKNNIPELTILNQQRNVGSISDAEYKKRKKEILDGGKHHFLVYLEDMGVDENCLKMPEILKAFKMGRHYNMWFIISVQSVGSCPREIIRQARITWTTEMEGSTEQLHRYVFPKFESVTEFRRLYYGNIQNYWVMIRDKGRAKHKGQTCYFVWKAPPVPDNHKIGCPEFRATTQFLYDPDAEKRNFDSTYEQRMSELLSNDTSLKKRGVRRH